MSLRDCRPSQSAGILPAEHVLTRRPRRPRFEIMRGLLELVRMVAGRSKRTTLELVWMVPCSGGTAAKRAADKRGR